MINKIDYCTNRTITDSFQDIEKLVEFIKSPSTEHLELVEYARTLERGSEEYRNIKINKLPAVTINFTFSNDYLAGKNVAEPSGYLYLDVDGLTEQDLEINTTYVCAHWRSLSNTGLTLVVKVDGLTPDNFKSATQEIANVLDIPFDKQAVSIDRLTVLSYDPNAYYNDNVEVFPIAEMIPEQPVELVENSLVEKSPHYNTIKYNSIGYDYTGVKLRFNNLDELLHPYNIVYDEYGFYDLGKDNKLRYAQVFVPFRKVLKGQRENILKSIAYQLIALNKTAPKELILKYLFSVNDGKMSPPLEKSEVVITFEKVYRQLNSIHTIPNAERRFIYDKSKDLSPTDKRRLNIKQVHQDRKNKTVSELLEVMQNWDYDTYGKITIEKLCEVTGKSKNTVDKYYKDLKAQLTPARTLSILDNAKALFKKFIQKNPLLKDLDDLMRRDLR